MDQEHSQLSGINSSENVKPNSRRRLLKGLAAGAAGLGVLSLSATALAQTAGDTAVEANGGANGYGVDATGGLAAIRLRPATGAAAGVPAVTGHQTGELYVDSNGSLFYSVKASATGGVQWRKLAVANLAATSANHTALGTNFAFPAPDRLYDGRFTTYTNLTTLDGATTISNSNMVVNTEYKLQVTGVACKTNGNTVPAGAASIYGTASIVAPNNVAGISTVFKLYPNTVAPAQTSSTAFLFGPGGTTAAFTVPLSSDGTLRLLATTIPASGGGFVVDVSGYSL